MTTETVSYILKKCISSQSPVELYTHEEDRFSIGIPLCLDDKGVIAYNVVATFGKHAFSKLKSPPYR